MNRCLAIVSLLGMVLAMTPDARAALGVTEGMLRLSVGLEDTADLCEDLSGGLALV